jgi:hypothetical protein
MPVEYSVYSVGPDDSIASRINLVCDNDDAAKVLAQQLVAEHAVELWRGSNLLARFEPEAEGPPEGSDFRSDSPSSGD